MKTQKMLMNLKFVARGLSISFLGLAFLASAPAKAEDKPTAIQGTFTFGGKSSTWSAKLTPKGDGTYDAVYVANWGGKPLNYIGTLKTDLKTEISGSGKANGQGANGNFEFSGKFDDKGVANCSYQEVNGRRAGALTAEVPK